MTGSRKKQYTNIIFSRFLKIVFKLPNFQKAHQSQKECVNFKIILNIRQVLCLSPEFSKIPESSKFPKIPSTAKGVRKFQNHIKHNIHYHSKVAINPGSGFGGKFRGIQNIKKTVI